MTNDGRLKISMYALVVLLSALMSFVAISSLVGNDEVKKFFDTQNTSNGTLIVYAIVGVCVFVVAMVMIVEVSQDEKAEKDQMEFEKERIAEKARELLQNAINNNK
jgi:hypothetical protein